MPLKRVVTSAAIAILGCSDAATGGADVPEFYGSLPSNTAGVEVPDEPADPAIVPPADVTITEPSKVDEPVIDQEPANEGQNPDDVQLEGGGTEVDPVVDPAAGGNEGNYPGNGMVGPGQGNGQGQEPEPEPEPEIVFPPLDCAAPRPTLTNGTMSCRVNASGGVDGQSWFMWYDGANGCMETFEGLGGAFRATWNNSGDFLARMGQAFDETQTFEQLGTISADLAFTRTGSAGGYSFIGIYGWSNEPLVEYYIVEDSFGNGPAVPFGGAQRGTFNVDGASYRVYTAQKTNAPSIHGTANFVQVFSVRQSPRQCGHVSISEHFRNWQGMGVTLGKMYEARVLVEAGGGTGSATFTRSSVTVTKD